MAHRRYGSESREALNKKSDVDASIDLFQQPKTIRDPLMKMAMNEWKLMADDFDPDTAWQVQSSSVN